jgi:hypothetical protein
MSVSDDVGNLFRRFGGDAGQYQEVARDDDAKEAALRWPLLNALDIVHAQPVPDAGRAVSFAAPALEPAPALSPVPETAPQTPTASEAPGPARAPLFARGHRHSSMPPPVAQVPAAASRFSVAPAAQQTQQTQTQPTQPQAQKQVEQPPLPQESSSPAQPSFSRAQEQTFAKRPFNNLPTQASRDEPKGGSILSNLFASKPAAPVQADETAPSRDLATLFARLSHPPSAPVRSLRDSLGSRLKPGGDA